MRYYGIEKNLVKERLYYQTYKFQAYLLQYLSLKPSTRKYHKDLYKTTFSSNPLFCPTIENISLPSEKYCTPFCIFSSDLILKEDILKLKAGLKSLVLSCTSKKYRSMTPPISEIHSAIDNMDSTFSRYMESIRIPGLTFDDKSGFLSYIDVFNITVKDFNSSFFLVEFQLFLSESSQDIFNHIITANFTGYRGQVKDYFRGSGKRNGGQVAKSITFFTDTSLKSEQLYTLFCKTKWSFYEQIQKFFPTLLHQSSFMPPAIYIYKTNIDCSDNSYRKFWPSVGISEIYGQSIDEARRLFFEIDVPDRHIKAPYNDLCYIINPDKINKEPYFFSIDSQVTYEFAEYLSDSLFSFLLLKAVTQSTEQSLVAYSRQLNRIKLNRNRLRSLLKLRYKFECSIDKYERLTSKPDIWNNSKNKISNVFHGKTKHYFLDYTNLIDSSLYEMQKTDRLISKLRNDFDTKTEILQHLADYKNESKNNRFSWFSTIASVITLYFLIFPENTKPVAAFLSFLVKAFATFIQTFKSII